LNSFAGGLLFFSTIGILFCLSEVDFYSA
jgi:hypothetical protein